MIRLRGLLVLLAVSAELAPFATLACGAEDLPEQIKSDGAKMPSIDELLLFFPSKHPAGNGFLMICGFRMSGLRQKTRRNCMAGIAYATIREQRF